MGEFLESAAYCADLSGSLGVDLYLVFSVVSDKCSGLDVPSFVDKAANLYELSRW